MARIYPTIHLQFISILLYLLVALFFISLSSNFPRSEEHRRYGGENIANTRGCWVSRGYIARFLNLLRSGCK